MLQMQTQITKREKSADNMATYFNHSTVNFNSYLESNKHKLQIKTNFMKFIHQENSNLDQEKTFT